MSSSSLRSLEYLETMPGTAFKRLYEQPSTVLAIFRRMLTHLAKTFVMAMLFLSGPISATDLESWARSDCRRERDQAVNLLERLKILQTSNPGKARTYALSHPFAGSLQQALTGEGDHRSFGVPCDTLSADKPSVEKLDAYARNQWDAILGYMVGSAEGVSVSSQAAKVSEGVKKLLREGGLVKGKNSKNPTITQDGFAFVLQDVNAQVWTILIYYLDAAQYMNMDQVDVLSFLFMLGSLELGQDYSKGNLSETQTQMLDDLSDFGLVYQTSYKSSRFFPTRLATTLTSDASALANAATFSPMRSSMTSGSSETQSFIVIETNYRIYAYTHSPLQIAILQLFTRLSTRYPNMVAGKITRESIRRAVGMGITADQIISFLQTHAHPQMRKNNAGSGHVLPPTVVDQIKLWQIENERMKATPGFLINDFSSSTDYESACNYAREIGVLAWSSDEKRMFFVTRVEQVAAFLKRGKGAKG